MEEAVRRSVGWGLIGALLLLSFYWLVLTLANSWAHAVEQWRQWWYWIVLLVIGFGSQVGLYSYIRSTVRERRIKSVGGEVAATGGVSAGSMVACCAHHVVDVLPILGLSAAAVFLVEYQLFFIVVGVVSNVVGIIYLLEVIKKHTLYKEDSGLGSLMQLNISQLRRWAVTGSVIVLVFVFMRTQGVNGQQRVAAQGMPADDAGFSTELLSASGGILPARTGAGGGLTIEVTPVDFAVGEPVQFDVGLNTHQGDLSFDLTEQSVLIDDADNEYAPVEWRGGKGGHHLSGKLIFPPINDEAVEMTLVIRDVYGVKEREFEWVLER